MLQCENCSESQKQERGCHRFGNKYLSYPRRIDSHSVDVPGEGDWDKRDWSLFCQASLDDVIEPVIRAVYTVLSAQKNGGIKDLSMKPLGHLSRRFGRLWRYSASAWERLLYQIKVAEMEALK